MDDVPSGLSQQFRSTELADAFVSSYQEQLARWPVPVSSMDVPGEYGTTRVLVCGPPEGAPAVLLHGHGCTSTVWFGAVAELARTHRVHALDQMGDAGMSVVNGTPIRAVEDFVRWLDGVLETLDVPAASFCGHSYGAWVALNYAVHRPAKVSKLVLLDPTDCFSGLDVGYRLRAAPLFVRPTAARARHVIEWESRGTELDPTSLTVACLGGGEFRGSPIVLPKPPKSDLLRAMDTPTLLLLAENSRAHDTRKVRARAEALLPRLTVSVLSGATHHSIPASDADHLGRELAEFLT